MFLCFSRIFCASALHDVVCGYIIQTFVFRRPAVFTRPLIFATAFMSFFSVVIALFKVEIHFLILWYCSEKFTSMKQLLLHLPFLFSHKSICATHVCFVVDHLTGIEAYNSAGGSHPRAMNAGMQVFLNFYASRLI